MDWRDTVKAWLEGQQRSAAWLARRARMNETYLYSLLSGAKTPGDKALRRLEDAMEMAPGTLVSQRDAALRTAGGQ